MPIKLKDGQGNLLDPTQAQKAAIAAELGLQPHPSQIPQGTTVVGADNIVLEGGTKVSVDTLGGYFRQEQVLINGKAPLPANAVFSRTGVAYALDISYDPVLFADGVPRLTRRGLFVSDVAVSANLLANPEAVVTQSVTLTAGAHTLQVWGAGAIVVTDGATTIGEATPGNSLTFTASAVSYTFTKVGDVSRAQLKKEAFPSQFSIAAVGVESCVIPTSAHWQNTTEFGIAISGQLRQLGVAQAVALRWADNSIVRLTRDTDGKWFLSYTIDGGSLSVPKSTKAYVGFGADVVLVIDEATIHAYCNGESVATITTPRPLTGSFSLLAHEWRSFIYRAAAYRTREAARARVRPASHYKLPPIVPVNPGDITRKIESAWGKAYARMTCAAANTIDLFMNYSQEGFSVGQSVNFSFWNGGLVGGVNVSGKSYVVESQQAGTGTTDRRVRFTVAGAVVDGVVGRGELVTVSTGFQAGSVHVVNSSVGQSIFSALALATNDTIKLANLSQGNTHGGVDLTSVTLTMASTGRLTGATGATGLISIFGGRQRLELRRVGSAKRPCVIDLDAYAGTNEDLSLPPYDVTNGVMKASGTYDPTVATATMAATNGVNTPNANTDIFVVGRTTKKHQQAYITGGNVIPAKIGNVFLIGGVYLKPSIGVQDHSGQDIYTEGVQLDNAGGARTESDLWYIRSMGEKRPAYRKTLFNCEGFNTGGSAGTLHSDGVQISGSTYNPETVLLLDRVHFTGTYQTVGFLAGQMAYASAADDQVYGKYRRTYRWLSDVQASSPKGEPNNGYLSVWWIDYTPGPNGFGFGGGNAPMPIHFNNFYSAPTQAKATFDSLFYRAVGASSFVQGVYDMVTSVQQSVNMILSSDQQSGKLPHGIGGKGTLSFGNIPAGLWPGNHGAQGALCVPGMGYQSPIAPFADGYFASMAQIPADYRRSLPVDFDWQSSNNTAGTVTLHLVNPDPRNPITAINVYRSTVPSSVTNNFTAYELPESGIGADKLVASYGDIFNGYLTASVTDTLPAGNGAYYRIGTVRSDGVEVFSTMWNTRTA